jgi:uncharacterized phosphosugar-binding protein
VTLTVSEAELFGTAMRRHLAEVESANAAVLDSVADRLLAVVEADALVYTGGSGHSLALVLETFYRAGGLACVYPAFHPGLLPSEGAAASTLFERTPGLAETILARLAPTDRDMAVIFSNSGANPFPVELGEGFHAAGTPVVAIVSRPHMETAPDRTGAKLGDFADYLIDTNVPAGDVAYSTGSGGIAALSSLVSVFSWNLLLARLADRAVATGTELPVWTSANVHGGDARNAALAARYRSRVPQL